ncbi:hypothetical protein QAD02_019771 [Eretmocerus hayati]|uniref:Uncharacterized protein n=1 Tax=Eretmocerus hayati TaxID=131215 RepID=A0ACC2PK64_9HYME|nr:hypothetical protein QAD02_019771 [Eretmocerus hayati]
MFPPRTDAPSADKLALCYAPHVDMTTVIEVEDRLTGHGGISSLGGGNSSPYSGAHHHGHRGNGNGGGIPHHGGASLPTASDFQPPYFPPPFPSHHHTPASPQHPGLTQPQHLDYLVGDPYTQTLNTLHQHHYNHLSAAVSAGQRSNDLRRDADIHVVSSKSYNLMDFEVILLGRTWLCERWLALDVGLILVIEAEGGFHPNLFIAVIYFITTCCVSIYFFIFISSR